MQRGRYGYVDEADGQKREYSYETGILCDPNKKDEDEEEELEAEQPYINYEQNQAVLANGQRIDLSNMGKNKSKRPQIYRN